LKEFYDKYNELDEFVKESFKSYKAETGNNYFILDDYEVKVSTVNNKKYEVPNEIKNKYVVPYSYDKVIIKNIGKV
jgi:hypothetical protein